MGAYDPITVSVVDELLGQIVDEMDVALEETAFSPIISEAHDRTSGLYRFSDGSAVAQGPRGLPLFMTGMQFMVQACKRRFPAVGPGDVIMINDPYTAGTHMQDLKVCKAVFFDGEPVMYVANAGHWVDMGGATAGGYCLDATDVHTEGIRIPPVLLYRDDVLDESVLDILMANIRIPAVSHGDLMAQVAALKVGEQRLHEVLAKYGVGTVLGVIDELQQRSARMMEGLIRTIPDGRYEAEAFLDNDGLRDEPVRARAAVVVDGSRLVVDFAGSSGPTLGPLNASFANTHSGVLIALKHIFPDVPFNGGAFDPIEVRVPEDCFLNAAYPAPGSGCSGEVAALVVDVVFAALRDALPGKVPASVFCSMGCMTMAGARTTGEPYVMYAFNGGGYSAFEDGDGLSHMPGAVGNAAIAPVEIVEMTTPVLIESFALRTDSGGPGRFRGGLGSQMVVRPTEGPAEVSILADNGDFPPSGAAGGASGAPAEAIFLHRLHDAVPAMRTKSHGHAVGRMEGVRFSTPGGGGWGDPLEREPESVRS